MIVKTLWLILNLINYIFKIQLSLIILMKVTKGQYLNKIIYLFLIQYLINLFIANIGNTGGSIYLKNIVNIFKL